VMDRLIQQALLQKLQPIFDPTFSEGSGSIGLAGRRLVLLPGEVERNGD